jgi:hypothetical protein
MADRKLPSSRFAKVPKTIRAVELVYLPKRLAIFMSKERQEAAGWSASTPKPVIAFKVKTPRQASEMAVRYLVQLSQQGHQVPVAKDIKQLTTVTKDPTAPASADEPVEDGEEKDVDKRTSFVRKLILQAFREKGREKSEGVMRGDSVQRGHEHLHRLVEANEQEKIMKRDPLHTFRVLSGIRSVLPSLEEALSGVTEHERRLEEWADVTKMSDEDLRKNYKIGKEREDALMGGPLKLFNAIRAEMKRRKMKVEGVGEEEPSKGPLGPKDIKIGMKLGSLPWVVRDVAASRKRVVVSSGSGVDSGPKFAGKQYTFVWDGTGYKRQGQYLHADGIHALGKKESSEEGVGDLAEAESFEVGPYSEYAVAQEKAMKIKSRGGKSIKIDKKKDKWVITYASDKPLHEAEDADLDEWGGGEVPHHGLGHVMPGQSKKKGKPMTITTHKGGKSTTRQVSEQKGHLTITRMVVEGAHGEKVSAAAALAKKTWAKALKGKDPKQARSAVWKAVKAEFPEFEGDTKLMNSLVDDTRPKSE